MPQAQAPGMGHGWLALHLLMSLKDKFSSWATFSSSILPVPSSSDQRPSNLELDNNMVITGNKYRPYSMSQGALGGTTQQSCLSFCHPSTFPGLAY